MDLHHDLPPRRRALFLPVVIATVALSVVGVSAGLVLSAQDRDRANEQWRQEQDQQQDRQAGPAPAATTTGQPCRPETQKMGARFGAAGPLTEVLVLRTGSSKVWICEDQAQQFYYHANRGGEDGPWKEGVTALFLSGVRGEGDAWIADASDGTRFSVNADRLLIIHKDGSEEEQPAA